MGRIMGLLALWSVPAFGALISSVFLLNPVFAQANVHNEPIQPIPTERSFNFLKVKLGETLFNDVRLSGDDTHSCASCHDINNGGGDGQPKSIGINEAIGPVNAPTVFNATFNISQFWDGRSPDLVDQVAGPIHNPKEMGSNWLEVISKLSKDADITRAFKTVYGGGITEDRIQDSIAAFERTLLTPNSRFDQFILGSTDALMLEEKRGYELFKSYGCIACHQGTNVGGNMYQKMGAIGDYFGDRGNVTEADLGRFNVTGDKEDRHVFKVPSLRVAVLTAPYFHDGSVATIEEAIRTMAKYQLGRSIPDGDIKLLVAFLKSLVGSYEPVTQ